MQLIPVSDKSTIHQFLEVPVFIHQDNPRWIRPLDKDIEEVFDPGKNKLFRGKENQCARWILRDDSGNNIGRIAVFVNRQYRTAGDKVPVGGMGFFECTNDQQAADFMFDHAGNWLRERGMGAMDGPINFGERDRWWGLLVEGFHEPLYCMNYNPPYYQQLFENYGFRVFFNQVCFALTVADRLQEKIYQRHELLAGNPDFHAEHFRKKDADKYAHDFCTVYNKAWAGHAGNKSMELRQAKKIIQSMKPVIDEDIVWFVYHRGDPIGIWLNLPDLNQWFRHLHGKFGLWQKIKVFWLKNFGKCSRFVGLVFGIVPEFQGKGIDAFMIVEGANRILQKTKYADYEMQWIGDFNPKMINIAESLGTHRSRRLVTYRYDFDRTGEFKRHPILG
ncbi:MAG TPA: hypothetical protein VFX43_17390 [Chitinophagaceae bacterium]|jgi:hypothetical protein|nr:hypothetical protein [Chitinophagaceae bacterium]